jgi:hypothetical protein
MIQMKDIGALIKALRAAGNAALTAGGAGDNTAVPGVILDRAAIGMPQSGLLAIPFTATLAAGETLSVTYTVAEGEAADLSDAATLVTGTVAAATGPTGGGTVTGCLELDVKLRAGGRYVRVSYTPDLSAADTDTAALSALLICGGMDRLPQ